MFLPLNLKDAIFTATILVPIITFAGNFLDSLLHVEVTIDRDKDAETIGLQPQHQTFDFIIGIINTHHRKIAIYK